MNKRVVVTGGAGFIGSHLVDRLVLEKYSVFVIDDLSGGYTKNINSKAQFHNADIRDYKKLQEIFALIKPEVVYHLAANAAESKAQFSPIDITSRNYDGAVKVLTAAINVGVRRFIFTSSIAVYGAGQTPFVESSQPVPEDVYGITKYAFEQTLQVMSEVHKFEYVIVRPHNVYGPRQNMSDPYRNVVTIFMNAVLAHQPLYIYGNGDQVRSFSFISDVTNALFACLKSSVAGMTFNIGSDAEYTISQLATEVLEIAQEKVKILYLPLRPQEVMVAVSDHTLSKKHLQYRDTVDLKTGLTETWKWVVQQGYQKPHFESVEIESKLLPKNWRQ